MLKTHLSTRRIVLILKVVLSMFIFSSSGASPYLMDTNIKSGPFKLVFTTGAQSAVKQLACSTAVTIQNQLISSNTPTAVPNNLTVNLAASNPNLMFYSDPLCANPVQAVTISSGTNSTSFYFNADQSTGSITIGANASGYGVAVQSESFAINSYLWTGTFSSSWSTTGNWAGGVVPTSSNIAYFSAGCVYCNVSIPASTVIGGIRIAPSFSGTLTQAGNLTLSTGGFIQQGGTYSISGTGPLTVSGSLLIAGNTTTFSSSSANINVSAINGSFAVTSTGSVNMGTGNLSISGVSNIIPGIVNYNSVTISPGSSSVNLNNGTMSINGALTLSPSASGGQINSGSFNVTGNLTGSSVYTLSGSANINLVGSTGSSISNGANGFPGSYLTINKALANASLTSALSFNGTGQTLNVTSGSLNLAGYAATVNALSLNGTTLTKSSGTLTVSGNVAGTGSLFGGTVAP